jgi:hypothetical protein
MCTLIELLASGLSGLRVLFGGRAIEEKRGLFVTGIYCHKGRAGNV